jgi:hypothetical protein
MLTHVHHQVGCFTFDYTNLVGADADEMASDPKRERAWQTSFCERDGRETTVGHFKWYRGVEIDPKTVKVECTPYGGPN